MQVSDVIEIRRLRVECWIGVPDKERALPQVLVVSVRMTPRNGFGGLEDAIEKTVDYYAVSLEIAALARSRPRRLIETLALEIAEDLLARHPLRHVAVSIEKHILPETEFVAVHLERSRES